jgi:hypothetical protein
MDRIDELGSGNDSYRALDSSLLAETEDGELSAIVEEASRELATPIALVTLVLEQIQFFKTHYGLPSDLAAARGTDRDVSFCQFVVKKGEPFEVNDAELDERVPKHLVKQYGIRSYLGIPVLVDDSVVGSLCVIDTQPRKFSTADRNCLKKLGEKVNQRLDGLNQRRKNPCLGLLQRTTQPAMAEIRDCLLPMKDAVFSGNLAAVEAGPELRRAMHMADEGSYTPEMMKETLESVKRALSSCQDAFAEIEASIGDAGDSLEALDDALTYRTATNLSTIAISGRELARKNVEVVGGVKLPDIVEDPTVSTPSCLGVALVADGLSLIAARMAAQDLAGGMCMETKDLGAQAEIAISGIDARDFGYEEIAVGLAHYAEEEPTVSVHATDDALTFRFPVVQT